MRARPAQPAGGGSPGPEEKTFQAVSSDINPAAFSLSLSLLGASHAADIGHHCSLFHEAARRPFRADARGNGSTKRKGPSCNSGRFSNLGSAVRAALTLCETIDVCCGKLTRGMLPSNSVCTRLTQYSGPCPPSRPRACAFSSSLRLRGCHAL